ncbi:MAG: hypothetical protein AB1Z81_08790 [Desulfotignum sp.]
MTTVEINAGICGFTTIVNAEKTTGYHAVFRLESQCPNWQKVNELLGGQEMDLMTELFKNRQTGEFHSSLLETMLQTIPHISCPVISGIFKALEVSAGLALPKDAVICFKE